jgi:hypothetical protein
MSLTSSERVLISPFTPSRSPEIFVTSFDRSVMLLMSVLKSTERRLERSNNPEI